MTSPALQSYQSRPKLIAIFSIFCLLPLAGSLSSYYEARGLQLAVFLLLALIVFATVLWGNLSTVGDQVFEILVWSVSLTLLLSSAAFSPYLWGWDIQREFAVFQQVSRTGVWTVEGDIFGKVYNSALSISILPTMVQAVSGLGGQEIFKFVYALVFSIVPVILFKMYRRMLCPKSACLSVFLFMSFWPFYHEVNQIGKQCIAELFFVLLIWASLSGLDKKRSGAAIAIVLTVGLVVSHYTLAYVYIGFATLSVVASRVFRSVDSVSTSMMVIFCGVITFVWYAFVGSGSGLISLAGFVSIVVESMTQDFLNPASRPFEAVAAAGLTTWTPGFLHDLNRLTNYIVPFCLLVGFIVIARRRNRSAAERKMVALMSVALVFIGSAVILPNFSSIPFSRIYHLSLIFASPCFVIGAQLLESWWRRLYNRGVHNLAVFRSPFSLRGKTVVAAAILLSYFLFTSGWVWAVSLDTPESVVLDGTRMANYSDSTKIEYYSEIDTASDVNAALWLRSYGETGRVCSDYISWSHALTAYGELENSTAFHACSSRDLQKSYIFLSQLSMLYAIAVAEPPSSNYKISLGVFNEGSNRLFSTGGASVYVGPA